MKRPAFTLLVHPFGKQDSLRDVIGSARTRIRRTILGHVTGPYSAFRSLARGLHGLRVSWNANPLIESPGGTVVVLEGVEALRRAIGWKREGRIQRLLAIPVGDFPSDYDGIMESPEIDACLMPSEWMRIAWREDSPGLTERLKVWAAGVDTEYWVSARNDGRNGGHAVVYWKTESERFVNEVQSVLAAHNRRPVTIRYGRYRLSQFRAALSGAKVAVFISRSETQGIALAEAWASDVPTFVWNPRELAYRSRRFSTVSSCPYLTEETGRDWVTFAELDAAMASLGDEGRYEPRKWVLENMSDAACARRLLAIVHAIR